VYTFDFGASACSKIISSRCIRGLLFARDRARMSLSLSLSLSLFLSLFVSLTSITNIEQRRFFVFYEKQKVCFTR